jgi:hypothetical protein
MLASVNPVLDPLLVTPLRNAVVKSAWGRGKKDIPPGIAKKLNDTTVITSTTPAAVPFRRDAAKSMRVDTVSDRAKGQKFRVKDERVQQGKGVAKQAQQAPQAPQAERAARPARQQAQGERVAAPQQQQRRETVPQPRREAVPQQRPQPQMRPDPGPVRNAQPAARPQQPEKPQRPAQAQQKQERAPKGPPASKGGGGGKGKKP